TRRPAPPSSRWPARRWPGGASAARPPHDFRVVRRPGDDPFTQRTPRVVVARKLLRRRERDRPGRFLAEGPQTVREAVDRGVVVELFGTPQALARHAD